MSEPRFDIIYDQDGAHIDYHFCRVWDQDGGCYGTNPDHGFLFREACDIVALHYTNQEIVHSIVVNYWKTVTLEEWEEGTVMRKVYDNEKLQVWVGGSLGLDRAMLVWPEHKAASIVGRTDRIVANPPETTEEEPE